MANGRHETCPACKGFAVTVWLLGELLADGAGAAIWRAAGAARADGHPCPGCRTPMHRVTGPKGATVEVCRDCEVVWVDAAVQPLLPARPELATMAALTGPGGLGTSAPTVCPNCGAPYSTTEDGDCKYCRAKVAQPVLATSAPELAKEATEEHLRERTKKTATDEYLDAVEEGIRPFRI
jgi:hypothetical protein